MTAQRAAGVLISEQATLAEQGDDVLGERLKAGREDGGHDVEAVGRSRPGPFLDRVGDLFGCAGEGPVAAAAAQAADELADSELVPAGEVEHQLRAALHALDPRARVDQLGQALVELERPGRNLEDLGQVVQPVLGDDQLLQFLLKRAGFRLGRADGGDQARQDLDLIGVTVQAAGPGLQVGVELLRVGQRLLSGEHRLRVPCRELAPVVR